MSEPKKTEVGFLLHLLSCAFNGKEVKAWENVDYKALLDLAKMHQVYNIIFPAISALEGVPEEQRAQFRDYSMSELKRMLVINNERESILGDLSEKGIRYMPLKGLILKAYYPKESMRQMSDNDILFDEENRDAVAAVMKAHGYKPTATGENSDDYFKEPFSTFEFHRTLFFREHNFCPEFGNLWENATQDEENPCLYHMGLDDVYIYNVCHMYKHFSTAGCGIRFLADNYLFLRKEGEKLNSEYVDGKLDEYGILDFERKTKALAFKIFDEEPLSEEDEKLLEVFVNFGIYGKGSVRIQRELEELAGEDDIEQAKRKYILKRLFPPKKKMKADYRVLEKHPYLLPAIYVHRFFKVVFNPKETVDEIKNVKQAKK